MDPIESEAGAQAPGVAFPLDAAGRLLVDVPCLRCGYNLRGVVPDGPCPECGTAAVDSMQSDRLCFCGAAWLARVYMGWRVAAVSLGAWVVLFVWSLSMMTAQGLMGVPVATAPSPDWYRWLSRLFLLTLMAAPPIGLWLLATPDPRKYHTERLFSARRLIRLAITSMLVLTGLVFVIPLLLPGFPDYLAGIAFCAYLLTGIIGVNAISRHLLGLALRIPDPTLIRLTRVAVAGTTLGPLVCWIMAYVVVFLCVQGAGRFFVRTGDGIVFEWGAGIALWTMMLGGLAAMLYFCVCMLLLTVRFWICLGRLARMARNHEGAMSHG